MNTRLGMIFVLALAGSASSPAAAREWTSSDGKKLDAEFVRTTGDMVTLKRATDGPRVHDPALAPFAGGP